MYDEYSRNSGKFYPLRYTRAFDIICLIVAGRREVTRQRLANTFILNWFHVTKMLIQRCHINFFDSSFRLTSEKKAKAPLYWSFEMVTGGFFSQRVINAENVSVSSAAEKAKSWVAQRTTHDWWLGGPSQFWVVRQWYTETMKSMKELVKMSQSVSALYSDTSPNRHTDGFVQDWGISSALAMEILQSCAKPWIRYQCICCLSTFLPKYFLQNINNSLVANRTIHGRTFSRPLDSWVAFGDRATVFQQHCRVMTS